MSQRQDLPEGKLTGSNQAYMLRTSIVVTEFQMEQYSHKEFLNICLKSKDFPWKNSSKLRNSKKVEGFYVIQERLQPWKEINNEEGS